MRRNVRTVNVQLHGIRGNEKRTESISFPLFPNVSDAELVRAAVFFSPNKWTVPFSMNINQFQGNFSKPLDAELLNALISQKHGQSARVHTLPQPLLHTQPTLSDTSPFQQQFQPPIPQPGQFQQPLVQNPQPPTGARGKRQGIWQWYRTRSRRMQVSLGCATLITVVLFFALVGVAIGSGNSAPPMATPTPAQQAVVTAIHQHLFLPRHKRYQRQYQHKSRLQHQRQTRHLFLPCTSADTTPEANAYSLLSSYKW